MANTLTVSALSKQSATLPMLANAPWRRSSRSSACELHSQPRSLWWMTPGTRPPRRGTAIVTASTTRSVLRWEAIEQPITIRLNTSVMQAR